MILIFHGFLINPKSELKTLIRLKKSKSKYKAQKKRGCYEQPLHSNFILN